MSTALMQSKASLARKYSTAKELKLIILPTEQCNFRCSYCYETFSIGKMKAEVIEGVKNLITTCSQNLKNLEISWFGGEPLLGYDIITDIMGHAKREIKEDSSLNSNMTTNGYLLTPKRLKCLVALGIDHYQISFDGDKEEHDNLRLRADGKGTFNVLWDNIIGAHNTNLPFEITLRVHANRNNINSIEKFIARVKHDLNGDKRFKLWIRPLSQLGGSNDINLPVLEGQEGSWFGGTGSSIQKLRRNAEETGLQLLESPGSEPCYAAKLNSFVIRSTGSISKCTVALYDK